MSYRHLSMDEFINVAESQLSTPLEHELFTRLLSQEKVVAEVRDALNGCENALSDAEGDLENLKESLDTHMDAIADICDEHDLDDENNSALKDIRAQCVWSDNL